MITQPVLIDGKWQQPIPHATFTAFNPATQQALAEVYPVSDQATVLRAVSAGRRAATQLADVAPEVIARFLERCADNLEASVDALIQQAHLETGLPLEPRLKNVELPRTTSQLRQAARAARERSFCQPVIDSKNDIRSLFAALGGPVVVMGPGNFPFAFNAVMGGDFAAALAAGNPVIAKAHPSHPGTSRLLAQAAFEAAQDSGLPAATVQFLYHFPEAVGLGLVAHPDVAATAFTGSRRAGLALKAAADTAGKLIYLELSSINPVFILPGAVQERGAELASELFSSCSLGAGQFCTNPGLSVVLEGAATESWLADLRAQFAAKAPGTLLSPQGPRALASSVQILTEHGARVLTGGNVGTGAALAFENTLLRVSAAQFLEHPEALQTEAFGPVHLVVMAASEAELLSVAESLEGSLTGCLYSARDGRDEGLYSRVAPVLRRKVGRLLNDKMPTGVTVSPAMNHGGPYPATGHPGFTSVGIPASVRRFTALHCYDGVRQHRLPPELRDKNPYASSWRNIDGTWTQGDVEASAG